MPPVLVSNCTGQGKAVNLSGKCKAPDARENTVLRTAATLAHSPVFRGMPDAFIARVAQHAIERHLRDADILYRKNDPDDFIAIVVIGKIYSTLYGPDGRELIIGDAGPGELVGETALADPRGRLATAFACGPTILLMVARAHFDILLGEPRFVARIVTQLCSRVRDTADFVESACLHRLEARLARHFIPLIDEQGLSESGGIRVPFPRNQSLLAAMVNASRPKINAVLQQWRRTGLVKWTNNSLLITDLEKFKRKAYADS